jgi:hypothetical protein
LNFKLLRPLYHSCMRGNWLLGFGPFFRDIFNNVVGVLTGVLSVLIAIMPVALPDFFSGNRGILHNRVMWWIAAALAYFIASRRAWDQQRAGRLAAEEKVASARPRLMVRMLERTTETLDLIVYHELTVYHMGGEPAQFIRVEPLHSYTRPPRLVNFNQVDFLTEGNSWPLKPTIHIEDFKIPENLGPVDKLRMFFESEVSDAPELTYPIEIRFRWNQCDDVERLTLVWNHRSRSYSIRQGQTLCRMPSSAPTAEQHASERP